MAGVGRFNKWVTLSRAPQTSPDSNGWDETLVPSGGWASIQPFAPGSFDGAITSTVTMRWHPQVGLDTKVTFETREFFVRGVQNVNEDDITMVLLCEEIPKVTP